MENLSTIMQNLSTIMESLSTIMENLSTTMANLSGGALLVRGTALVSDLVDRFRLKYLPMLAEYGGVSAGKTHTCAVKCETNPSPAIMYDDIFCLNYSLPCKFSSFPPSTCTQGEIVCWGDDVNKKVSGNFLVLFPWHPKMSL